jgi:hypothetical protein
VKNEDKDPLAQMEWRRKPIIGAINDLHITAGFEIAQTNINKNKNKKAKLIKKKWKQMKQGEGNTVQ